MNYLELYTYHGILQARKGLYALACIVLISLVPRFCKNSNVLPLVQVK